MSPDPNEPDFQRGSFVQNCVYCGARFEVFVSTLADSDEQADYACPECGKTYSTRGALEPQVQLLIRRRDGKTDAYSETMF